jgi:hypothetical protein
MKTVGDLAGSLGEFVADSAIGHGDAVIDARRSRPRLLASRLWLFRGVIHRIDVITTPASQRFE